MRFTRFLALGVALACALPVHAGDPPPFPEFTFKKGKPPKKGGGKLITVQIDPEDQAHLKPRPKDSDAGADAGTVDIPVVPSVTAAYGWFWTKVPTDDKASGPDRLRLAFETLRDGPGGASVKGPRLQHMQEIARAHGADILRATIGTEVSPALVLAVISVESGGRTDAISGAGAQGLMQLIPATAQRFGVSDSMLAGQNIKGGVAYLDWLMKEFRGDAVLALAGYNAGENAVKKHAGVPPYAETRDYVPKVLAAFQVASGLCKTRPELITDACALTLASY
ncbi:lytic transglycosylase domain-containing protein [Roseovarius atlanticus]|uniref:lytic transglycosylase domain-containing protein n=1 Tax=Roseovarius atlanticus TaxID=1641875 RepID=UPI001C946182|nr:lytic transglycosylase domain-containing protein [Roseovarius atlanticus]MBY5987607.1 lytic transglycosylase domain-containing protein [Roseovarius atlanticus]MBY6122998.1 lytic transglycosylase domain-containing protein [Roseovarius atlanticus]MBY6147494.1 lytic transglycosylase domain-containing protein [Roseovarius atlanticus]